MCGVCDKPFNSRIPNDKHLCELCNDVVHFWCLAEDLRTAYKCNGIIPNDTPIVCKICIV